MGVIGEGAHLRRKDLDRSQMIHLSLTARSNMRMTAIQMKAVRKSRSRMVVRGRTRAWGKGRCRRCRRRKQE